jgi:histidine phosphotransferase ChpT
MDDRLHLTELVCARLCHDLGGSLGLLVDLLELVAEESGSTEALSIATENAAAATRRLKLLRAAWTAPAEPLDLLTLADLAEDLARRQIHLDLTDLPTATVFPAPVGRLVLNLLLLALDALPRGGVLRLEGGADEVIVRLEGPNATWPASLAGLLSDPASAWQALIHPRSIQAPLTVLLADHHGLRLSLLPPAGAPGAGPRLRLSTT